MHTEISPWIEKLSPYRLVIALGAAFLALVVALAWVGWRWSVALDRMEIMQRQAAAGFLQAEVEHRHGANANRTCVSLQRPVAQTFLSAF